MTKLIQAFSADENYEDKPVDPSRYELRITSAKVKESNSEKRSGAKYIGFGIQIEGVDGAATIFHNMNIPWTDAAPSISGQVDEPRAQRMMLRDIRRFFRVFGVPDDSEIDGDTVADIFVGLTGQCNVTKVEAQDRDGNKTGEFRNELRLPAVQ